jgi:diacylglycerol O-acyltransferase / wax synthase
MAKAITRPLHIACLVLLDAAPLCDARGGVRSRMIRTQVKQRRSDFDSAHLKLRDGAFAKHPYEWEVVDSPNPSEQIKVVRVSGRGTERDMLNCCAKLLEPTLPGDHPMWRLYILTGISNERLGLLFQIHHSLADGVVCAAMLSALTDQVLRRL